MQCVVVSFDDYRHTMHGGSVKREPERTTTAGGTAVIHVTGKSAQARAQELAANFVADVVHVHHESLWEFARDVARFNHSPTVYTVHVLQSEQNRLRDVRNTHSSDAQDTALAECSVIHAPSQAVSDILVESTLALGQRLKLVRLGNDDWPGAIVASEQERFEGMPMLLYVGRFADINGFTELLSALPAVFEAHPTLRATIAGGMPGNPRAEKRWKRRWEKLAGEHAARLHWAGWQTPGQLSELYGRATMLVVPSWFETFGQVVLEGMLHGAPLITTGTGAIAELVDQGSALLIEPQNPTAISDAVDQLLTDPVAAETRRQHALQRAGGQHWDDRMGDFREMYEAAIGASNSAVP